MMFNQQAFNKAKIKTVLAGIFVCLLFCAGMVGCKKEIGQQPDNPLNTAVQDRSEEVNPTVTHGMLHFDSFGKLADFTASLENKEADTTQVKNAYAALGINVNAETIPNLTDHPVCLTTEMAIGGYTSARKSEETVINAALDQGDDNINSVVIGPYWKTALNADRAVHIGKRIYKYYDNGGIAIVLNDDWTLYDAIKSQTFESLRESYNLIVTSDTRNDWDKYFTFNSDESINAEKKIFLPRFTSAQASDGKLAIDNISLVETTAGTATFTWLYPDNTSSTGQLPNRQSAKMRP